MMSFNRLVVVAVMLGAICSLTTNADPGIGTLTDEDRGFWNRFLRRHAGSYSMSSPPSSSCQLDLDLDCRIAGTGIPCDQYLPDTNCSPTLEFQIRISNVGATVLEVTEFSLVLNEDTIRNLLILLLPRSLPPNESTTVQALRQENLCRPAGTFNYQVSIQAEPPAGELCQATDELMVAATPPTPRPTFRPTPLPTKSPLNLPSRRPTPIPTRAPTPLPTSRVDCSVDVQLDCQVSGQSCASVGIESTVCDVGEPIDNLVFRYMGLSCNALGNSQGSGSMCQDLAPIMFSDPVTIQCGSPDGAVLNVQPVSVAPGESFSVSNAAGFPLPEQIVCTIRDVDGTDLQTNTIATSGDVRLDLGDEFGALRLAGCDRDGMELSCYRVFSYEIVINNDGPTILTLTRLDFMFGGIELDLFADMQMMLSGLLLPGTSTTVSPTSRVNICDSRVLVASVEVGGDPPNGDSCVDSDDFRTTTDPLPPRPPTLQPTTSPLTQPTPNPTSLPTKSPTRQPSSRPSPFPTISPTAKPQVDCSVNAEISCSLADGRSCRELESRNTNCPEVLIYPIEVCNTGTVPMQIFQADFTLDGQASNLLESLPINPVPVGACLTVTPRLEVDVCGDFTYVATIEVSANPPNGAVCQDSDQRIVIVSRLPPPPTQSPTTPQSTPVPTSRPTKLPSMSPTHIPLSNNPTLQPSLTPLVDCNIEVTLQCQIRDGTQCQEIMPRQEDCFETVYYGIEICNVGSVETTFNKVDFILNGQRNELLLSVPRNPLSSQQCTTMTPSISLDLCTMNNYTALVEVQADPLNGNECNDFDRIIFVVSELPPPPTARPTTSSPSIAPSNLPSLALTQPPSVAPRVDCSVELELQCLLNDGTDCSDIEPRSSNCQENFFFEFRICNTGTVELEVISVIFTFNEQENNLDGNVSPNPIPVGQCATLIPNLVLDACSDNIYLASVEVEANPPNGSTCQAADQLQLIVSSLPTPPTPNPSQALASQPTSIPTNPPTVLPSLAVTPRPPVAPTVDCSVEVELQCLLSDGTDCRNIEQRSSNCQENFFFGVRVCNTGMVEMEVKFVVFTFNDQENDLDGNVSPNPIPIGQCATLTPNLVLDVCSDNLYLASVEVEANPPNGSTCQAADQLQVMLSALPPPRTPNPSQILTSNPTSVPSNIPTSLAVTQPPSVAPRIDCSVEVELRCLLNDGTDCSDIEPRSTNCQENFFYAIEMCNIGEVRMEIVVVAFLFNNQENELVANATPNPISPGQCIMLTPSLVLDVCREVSYAASVRVEANPPNGAMCRDTDQLQVTVASLPPSQFTSPMPSWSKAVDPSESPVQPPSRGPLLPTTLNLQPSSQSFTSEPTSSPLRDCDVDIFLACRLSDGSDCSTLTLRNDDCNELLLYNTRLCNIGAVPMEVQSAEFTFNGQRNSVLSLIVPNPIPPNQCSDLTPSLTIDACTEGTFVGSAEIKINPSNGNGCEVQQTDQIDLLPRPSSTPAINGLLPSESSCGLDLSIDCATLEGDLCSEIAPPSDYRCNTNIALPSMQFSYQNCDCTESDNSQATESICIDEAPLVADEVLVKCFNGEGGLLNVLPSTVGPAGSFTVSTLFGGPLPVKTECVIMSSNGTKIQTNIIDTSGQVPLSLGDKFGALQVEACLSKSCKRVLCYELLLANLGDADLNVTSMSIAFNDGLFNILENLVPVVVKPNQNISLEEKFEVSVCLGESYNANVEVQAGPVGDVAMCENEESFSFTVPQISPLNRTAAPVATLSNGQCGFSIDFRCTLSGDNHPNAGKSCETHDVGIVPVLARPIEVTMLFTGGGCERSSNRQYLKATCEDGEGSSPPTEFGEEVHIRVTDIKGLGIVYFDGVVGVGDRYTLSDSGNEFQADQMIIISTLDQSSTLQKVQYRTSGSENLELKNSFGASQLVGFYNNRQGNVTCLQTVDLSVNLDFPLAAMGETITVSGLTANTNFVGEIDLTPQAEGKVIEAGTTLGVTLSGTLDLSIRRQYIATFRMIGARQPGDNPCEGTQVLSFEAGIPLPPTIPTVIPTIAPSVSPAPSPDLLSSACSIESLVVCEVIRNGRAVGDCDTISDPRGVSCAADTRATELSFIYRRAGGAPASTTVLVDYGDGEQSFEVSDEQLFTVEGDFRGRSVIVKVEGVDDFDIDIVCDDGGEVSLGTMFGPLELVGFENEFGYFTSIYEIRLTYLVRNGPLDAVFEGAVVYSSFIPEPLMLLDTPLTVDRGRTITVYQDTTVIDSIEKFSQDRTFNFSLDVTAAAEVSKRRCISTFTYQF